MKKYLNDVRSTDVRRTDVVNLIINGVEYTPLMIACIFNIYDSVKILLQYDIEINKVDIFGISALMHACEMSVCENNKCVKLLLSHPKININLSGNLFLITIIIIIR